MELTAHSYKLAWRIAVAALWLCAAGSAPAANFVSGAKVSKIGNLASIAIRFNCNVSYISHDPAKSGDQLRIQLEPTTICRGVSPQIAEIREQLRPVAADDARLVDIEYDGTSPAGPILRLSFADNVAFGVDQFANASSIFVRVYLGKSGLQPETVAAAAVEPAPRHGQVSSGRVRTPEAPPAQYVINLRSSTSMPATKDLPRLDIGKGQKVFVSEAAIDGQTWYRIRLGYFPNAEVAVRKLAEVRAEFPGAWIDQVSDQAAEQQLAEAEVLPVTSQPADDGRIISDQGEIAALMRDAKRAMTAGELSKAVQIYTKVLQQPESPYHPEAQEFLALARERNGQLAHAKAEYQRYLANYPDGEGATRVGQRLSALLSSATTRPDSRGTGATAVAAGSAPGRATADPWTIRTFFTQYYRRDVNQFNDNDQVISQSALYSDVNLDVRRRGDRYDFSARVSGGYRYDFLPEDQGSGNDFRMSYAYADLADARLGLRGRLGRQSRNTGGVLGRFDGLNVAYQATEKLRFETVAGKPVNSVSDGVDDSRAFYGVSSNFVPFGQNLDMGVFFLQQNIAGMTDRQALGAEMRYFGEQKSLWAMVDYDTEFQELGSLFVQGSLRLPSEMTLTGVVDRRRSPFLSASNALIGQGITDFDQLQLMYTEDEIRQLALDRAAATTTVTLGLSRPLSPKLQFNVNASESRLDATPDSGGVTGAPASTYRYLSTDLVASSLLTEGDVTIFGLRYADADTSQTYTVNLDTRFPLGKYLRVNPRLRVDYREITSDGSTQWTYTPGLRLQYRKDRRFRVELETGILLSSRQMTGADQDRQSWFVNLGYQLFY